VTLDEQRRQLWADVFRHSFHVALPGDVERAARQADKAVAAFNERFSDVPAFLDGGQTVVLESPLVQNAAHEPLTRHES
jgi:hypothetical protein